MGAGGQRTLDADVEERRLAEVAERLRIVENAALDLLARLPALARELVAIREDLVVGDGDGE